jgi:hypothetical protein
MTFFITAPSWLVSGTMAVTDDYRAAKNHACRAAKPRQMVTSDTSLAMLHHPFEAPAAV